MSAVAPAPTLTFTASPTTVTPGSASTLTWSATNVTTCIASGDWSGSKATGGSQSTGALSTVKTYTYTLRCIAPGGDITRSVTVSVSSVALAPTLTFTASPTTVTPGGASTLTWSSTNVTTCIASGDWSGSKATGGSQSTGALFSSKTYSLTCTGAGGSVNRSVTINVGTVTPAPTLIFTASPTTVSSGGSSMLNWSATNVTTCIASGDWTGSKALSGSQSTGVLTTVKTYTYTLRCIAAGGDIIRSVIVNVTPVVPVAPSIGTITADDCTIMVAGESECDTKVRWNAPGYINPKVYQGGKPLVFDLAVSPPGGYPTKMKFNTRTFRLYDNSIFGVVPGTDTSYTANIYCGPGLEMNTSGVCVMSTVGVTPLPANIDIIVEPSIIRSGDTTRVRVKVETSSPATCTHYGIQNSPGILTHDGSPSSQDWNLTTRPLMSTQIIKVKCVLDGLGIESEKEERINVIPNFEET
ncbi:MAG: hypothetical protein UZ19_OD1000644 [Parcubacteria bacterium OLB19]|nr:MAG: hypothetical protein UZ19_OD1000644 [Parcubacteria bacterium OLB19]